VKYYLKNDSGRYKEIKFGFCWTTLFFGFFPALYRGDWKWAFNMFVTALFTFGISWFVFPFIYNKLYIQDLLFNGYDTDDYNVIYWIRENYIVFPGVEIEEQKKSEK
jgi:hypothetical protein